MKASNPNGNPKQMGRLLRALAQLVESSTTDEVLAIIEQKAATSRGKRQYSLQDGSLQQNLPSTLQHDVPKLAEMLQSLGSRDEGYALLSSLSLSRRELEGLGRILGTPILKADNMERLREKIIEASIGSRLSSEAIRGNRQRTEV